MTSSASWIPNRLARTGLCGLLLFLIALALPWPVTGAAQSLDELQYQIRALQNRQAEGRYVDQQELARLQKQLTDRAGDLKLTRLRADTLSAADNMPDDQLKALRDQAYEFLRDNSYDYVRSAVRDRQATLREEINRASNAREVAQFLEQYTYTKDAPRDNPALAEFYNNVYSEQGWIQRNLGRRINEHQRELDRLSTFDTIEDGINRALDMRRQAEAKLEEYKQELSRHAQGLSGLDDQQFAALQKKVGEYTKYARQAQQMVTYVTDLRDRAAAAGDSIPDLPEAARQGLRNMVYIGEALKQAGDRINVPGVSDMLGFYSDATRVSLVAAQHAQDFKLGHGEIDSANQLLSPYNPALEQLRLTQATMTDFGAATGIRVILGQDFGRQGYYILDNDYTPLNREPLSAAEYEALKRLYGNFDAIRRDDSPLSPSELALALALYQAGKPVEIRGRDFGERASWLDWQARMDAEDRARNESARDIFESVEADLPRSLRERVFGRDEDAYIRSIERLISEWSDYDMAKLGAASDTVEQIILEGLEAGRSFSEIEQGLRNELAAEKALREEMQAAADAASEADSAVADHAGTESDPQEVDAAGDGAEDTLSRPGEPDPTDSDTHANDETGADHDSEMGGESATDGEGEAQGEIGSDFDAETGDGRTTTVSGPESRPESEAEPGTGEEAEYGSDQEGLDGEHELADITSDEADRADVSEPGAQAARVPEFRPVAGLSEDETQALLNCLCRASLGAASHVSQSYNLTIPRWADPKIHSCGSLANGPCMASAFGCWRSFIRFNSEQARGCVTGAGLDPDDQNVLNALDRFNQEVEEPVRVSLSVEPQEYCPGDEIRVSVTTSGGRGDYSFAYHVGERMQPSAIPPRGTSERSFSFVASAEHYPSGAGPGGTVFVRAMSPTAPTRTSAEPDVIRVPSGVAGQYQSVRFSEDSIQIRMRSRADCFGEQAESAPIVESPEPPPPQRPARTAPPSVAPSAPVAPRPPEPAVRQPTPVAPGASPAPAATADPASLLTPPVQVGLGTTSGQLGPDAHEAHQAISVPQHGSLRVDVDADEGLTVRLQLQDADGRQLVSDWQGSSATRSVEQADLAPGTYVARVHRAGGEGGYRLTSQLTAPSVRNDSEAGDTFQQAVEQSRPLPLNQHSTGLLGFVDRSIRDTDDWVSLNVTEYGALSVSVTAEESLTVRLLLQDADGRQLTSDWQGVASTRELTQADLAPGQYYVRVQRSSGQGGYVITPRWTPVSFTNDQEPNDRSEQAQAIPLGHATQGLLGYVNRGERDTEDWFQFEMAEYGSVSVSVNAEDSLTVRLLLLDADGRHLASDWQGVHSVRNVAQPDLAPGTYFVRIQRGSGQGGYVLIPEPTAVSFVRDQEPNDSAEHAQAIPLGHPTQGLLGYVNRGERDTEDWFQFEMAEYGSVSVSVNAEDSLTVRLLLLDADGRHLASDWQGVHSVRNVAQPDLAPGTYFVRIQRGSGQGGYVLTPKSTPVSYARDSEPNDRAEQAQAIPLGRDTQGLLGYVHRGIRDNEDWFRVETPQHGELSVSVAAEQSLQIRVMLQDAAGRQLASDWQGVHSSRRVVQPDLPPGHYYVRVHRGGGQGGYSLKPVFAPAIGNAE